MIRAQSLLLGAGKLFLRILVKKKEKNITKSLDTLRSIVTDACKTPSTPPAPKVPYPNTALSSDTTNARARSTVTLSSGWTPQGARGGALGVESVALGGVILVTSYVRRYAHPLPVYSEIVARQIDLGEAL